MDDLTHLSLFSGIGGLDLAAEWAGFRTVGQCEWADYPRAVLEKHWPGLPRWRDIRTLTGESFYEQTGLRTVTVVSGGFPCQPFSTAGKRRGKDDDRYLWPEMLRVISQIRPAWVVGENVAGIVSMALDTVLSDLESIGYACQALVIPACAVDAPHRRDRVAIVGYAEHNGLSPTAVPRIITTAGRDEQEGQNQTSQSAGAGLRGNGAIVAYSDCTGQKRCEQHRASFDRESCCTTCQCGETVPNTDGPMRTDTLYTRRGGSGSGNICEADSDRDDRRWDVRRECQLSTAERNGGCRSYFTGGAPEYGGGEWWPAEPDVGRVANGVPSRVDRLKCLGNAVVPQQFCPIFRAIADLEVSQWENTQ